MKMWIKSILVPLLHLVILVLCDDSALYADHPAVLEKHGSQVEAYNQFLNSLKSIDSRKKRNAATKNQPRTVSNIAVPSPSDYIRLLDNLKSMESRKKRDAVAIPAEPVDQQLMELDEATARTRQRAAKTDADIGPYDWMSADKLRKRRAVDATTSNNSLTAYEKVPVELQGAAAIIFDPTLTKTERQQRLDNWVAVQNASVQALYNEVAANFSAKYKALTNAFDAKLATLSPAAQTAAGQIKAVFASGDLTWSQIGQQVRTIVSGLTADVQTELRQAYASIAGMQGEAAAAQSHMAAFFSG